MSGSPLARTPARPRTSRRAWTPTASAPLLRRRDPDGAAAAVRLDAATERLDVGRRPTARSRWLGPRRLARPRPVERLGGGVDGGRRRAVAQRDLRQHPAAARPPPARSTASRAPRCDSLVAFRDPVPPPGRPAPPRTAPARSASRRPAPSLVALCRPFRDNGPYATRPPTRRSPPSCHLSPDAVKRTCACCSTSLGVEDLPHNRKRARLMELAFDTGTVQRASSDLGVLVPGPRSRATASRASSAAAGWASSTRRAARRCDRPVALKLLAPATRPTRSRERFRREAELPGGARPPARRHRLRGRRRHRRACSSPCS